MYDRVSHVGLLIITLLLAVLAAFLGWLGADRSALLMLGAALFFA